MNKFVCTDRDSRGVLCWPKKCDNPGRKILIDVNICD